MRAGYRAVEAEAGSGWLIVLSAREGAADAKSTDIARDLAYAFKSCHPGTPRASDADKLPRTCVDTAAADCLSGGAVAQSEKPPQAGSENTAAGDPSDACAQTQKEKIESAEQNTTTEAPQEGV